MSAHTDAPTDEPPPDNDTDEGPYFSPVSFEIEADTAAVLKPVINAAKRNISTARVEVDSGGVRIRGNDAATVSLMDIDVSAEGFEHYRFEPGEFNTDMDEWWEAYRGTRKTDDTRIYTREPEYDDLDDITAITGAKTRVLESRGITTVDQLRAASPRDMTGSIEYETEDWQGNEVTREASIDESDARKLLRKFNPYLVIEVDGEDQIDGDAPDDYPRVRLPELDPQEPETDIAGTATLNARDFSKAFRAIEKVDDSVFLGLTENRFIMYGDGDKGEVHAMPDAQVSGNASGGLYSADYLNSLRLSIDRRASTTLELALPRVGPDADDDHPHVLRAEYPIEKDDRHAMVTYWMAPRIIGKDQDEFESERSRLDRIAPSAYEVIGDTRASASMTAEKAKAWFGLLGSHADECRLTVSQSGLWTKVVDAANVILNEIDVPPDAFDAWEYTGTEPIETGFSQDRMLDFLRLFTKTDDVALEFSTDAAWFSVGGEHFTLTAPAIDPDSIRHQPNLPGLKLPAQVTVEAGELVDALDDAAEIAQHVTLIVYDGELYLFNENDMDGRWQQVEVVEGEGYAASVFSLDYLADYFTAMPTAAHGHVELAAGREFPLYANHPALGADFTMMLAPRITEDQYAEARAEMDERGLDHDRLKNADYITEVNPDDMDVESVQVDEPDEPEEVEVDGDPDDPDDWDPEPVAERIRKREAARKAELTRGVPTAPHDFDPRIGTTTIDINGEKRIPHADAENPGELEHFEDMMSDIYDPTEEFDEPAPAFEVGSHHRVTLPAEINGFELVRTGPEGRPTYAFADAEIRIARSHATDVVHRRYRVLLSEGEEVDQLATGLSPEEAMDLLFEVTEDYHADSETVEEPEPDEEDPEPEPDAAEDVAAWLRNHGVNNVTAHNIGEQFGTVDEARSAVESAEDVTDIHGVGEASAVEVREAFGIEASPKPDDPEPKPSKPDAAACPAGDREADEMALSRVDGIGPKRADQLLDAFGDLRTVSRKASSATAEIAGVEGFSQDTADDLFDRMRDARVFVSGASGTGRPLEEIREEFCPTIEEPEWAKAVEAATETPEDKELDGPALQAIEKAWTGYRHAMGEGHEAAEAVEEYREKHREAALEYAAIINDIRAAHGQEPIDFDGVPGIPPVDPVAGQITEDHPDVVLSFNWDADPYDPVEELA